MELIAINQIKPNPKNPRTIKPSKFKALVNSIKEFPEMLELRPIVVDEDMVILGGNMRFKAIVEAGFKEVYITRAENLTQAQKDEFIIKDNANYGDWDWDVLANEYQQSNLQHWGLDVWDGEDHIKYQTEDPVEQSEEEQSKPSSVEVHKPVILQLEFEIGDYQSALDLVKRAKSQGHNIGHLLIQSMQKSLGHGGN
jgi:hypothetical protein